MPVKSIANRINTDPTIGMPFFGWINKGAKRTEEMLAKKQPGPDLEYFRVTFSDRYKDLEADFRRIYGDQPSVFDPVLVVGKTPDEVLNYWYERRDLNGKRVSLRCDGEQIQMWYDSDGKKHDTKWGDDPRPCEKPGGCDHCKVHGWFHIWFPRLLRETGRFGVFVVQTGSPKDAATILGSLTKHYQAGMNLETFPFRLGRERETLGFRSYKKGNDLKWAETVKSMVYLEPSEMAKAQLEGWVDSQMGKALPPGGANNALPAVNGSNYQQTENGAPTPLLGGSPTPTGEDVADGHFSETLVCRMMQVELDGMDYFYVAICDGQNVPLETPDVFAGLFDVSKWRRNGYKLKFNPPILLTIEDGQATHAEPAQS